VSKLMLGAGALIAAVALAACGGDDDPSKTEFIKDANAICKEGDKRINADAEKAFSANKRPSKAEVTKFSEDTAIPEIQAQIDDLRDLGAPSGDDEKVSAILDEAQSALDEVEADPTVFLSDTDPFAKANKLAKGYGLTECAG